MSETKTEIMRLSPSVAGPLIDQSALHGWTKHRLGGNQKKKESAVMRKGNIFEAMLGFGTKGLGIVEAASFKGKAAIEEKLKIEAMGRIPVLAKEFEKFSDAVEIIQDNMKQQGIIIDGEVQYKMRWEKDGVHCSGVPDVVNHENGLIRDLKMTGDASIFRITKQMLAMNWAMQGEAYREGFGVLYPALVGRINVQFIVCEWEAPYSVVIAEPTGAMQKLGLDRWDRAKSVFKRCIKNNDFPGYPQGVQRIEPSKWQLEEAEQLKWEEDMENTGEES